jgi:hypothetical protein
VLARLAALAGPPALARPVVPAPLVALGRQPVLLGARQVAARLKPRREPPRAHLRPHNRPQAPCLATLRPGKPSSRQPSRGAVGRRPPAPLEQAQPAGRPGLLLAAPQVLRPQEPLGLPPQGGSRQQCRPDRLVDPGRRPPLRASLPNRGTVPDPQT